MQEIFFASRISSLVDFQTFSIVINKKCRSDEKFPKTKNDHPEERFQNFMFSRKFQKCCKTCFFTMNHFFMHFGFCSVQHFLLINFQKIWNSTKLEILITKKISCISVTLQIFRENFLLFEPVIPPLKNPLWLAWRHLSYK